MECECDDIQYYFEYSLLGFGIFETLLSYTPDGYPKSTLQLIVFVFYQLYLKFKKKPVIIESNELVDIIIK